MWASMHFALLSSSTTFAWEPVTVCRVQGTPKGDPATHIQPAGGDQPDTTYVLFCLVSLAAFCNCSTGCLRAVLLLGLQPLLSTAELHQRAKQLHPASKRGRRTAVAPKWGVPHTNATQLAQQGQKHLTSQQLCWTHYSSVPPSDSQQLRSAVACCMLSLCI